MKIQRGIVQYQDRNDIECLYGVLDDNTQYYFMDNTGKTLANGNIIASTSLTEAIDPMYESKKVGLIDPQGNVVIPFENKSIKPINDGIILVERAVPVSQSVIDARNLKNDPLSATQLVSTAATIKANLNSLTAGQGEYVFNDLFSEATICDINGNNLLNGEYYSFITMTNEKLFFSKNTADSQIIEYSLLAPQTTNQVNESNNAIDVNNINVDAQQVDNALQQNDAVSNPENIFGSETQQTEPNADVQDFVPQPGDSETIQSDVDTNNQAVKDTLTTNASQPIENGVIQVSDQLQQDVVQGDVAADVNQSLNSEVSVGAVAPDLNLNIADGGVSQPIPDSIDAALNPAESVSSEVVQDTTDTSLNLSEEDNSVSDESNENEGTDEIEEPEMPSSDDSITIDGADTSENNGDVQNDSESVSENSIDLEKEESSDISDSEQVVEEDNNGVNNNDVDEVSKVDLDVSDKSDESEDTKDSGKNIEEKVIDENDLLNSVVNSGSEDEAQNDDEVNKDSSDLNHNTDDDNINNKVSLDLNINVDDDNTNNEVSLDDDTETTLESEDLVSEDGFESIFNEDMDTDIFKNSVARTDTIRTDEDDFRDSYDRDIDRSSHVSDAVSNVNRLIRGYKKLQGDVYHLNSEIKQIRSKYKSQSEQMKKAGVVINKINTKNQMLQSENSDLKKENMKKDKQIKYLTDQLRGYSEIAKLGNIAGELLNDNYDEYDDSSYYRMSA